MKSLAICAVLFLAFQSGHDPHSNKITSKEISAAILKESECTDPELKLSPANQLRIDSLEYFDFDGDGQEEAVVVASTCMTGTGGPDIHTVYKRDARGAIYELPIGVPLTNGEMPPSEYGMLFGNRNSDFSVENGLIVETWYDSSGRKNPLIIRYKWDGKKFAIHSVEKTGPFKTSYDCTKAEKEVEQEICYVKTLADLDLQLAQVYRKRLREVPDDKRKMLREEQREWLAKRNTGCNYKLAAQCLEELYKARITELSAR